MQHPLTPLAWRLLRIGLCAVLAHALPAALKARAAVSSEPLSPESGRAKISLSTAEPYPETLSAGNAFTCGLKAGGSLACWGDNTYGQAWPPGGTFTQVSAGDWHTCALK